MKYIRTKDNKVYRVSDNLTEESIKLAMGDICLKVGDTIEELCDEFVIDKFGEKDVYKELSTGLIQKHLVRNHIIYGAIWTDEGLIYVARMNKKGELELL